MIVQRSFVNILFSLLNECQNSRLVMVSSLLRKNTISNSIFRMNGHTFKNLAFISVIKRIRVSGKFE